MFVCLATLEFCIGSGQYTGPPIAAPHMAPVPVSSTGAVPQKLAGYKGGALKHHGKWVGYHGQLMANLGWGRVRQDSLLDAKSEFQCFLVKIP